MPHSASERVRAWRPDVPGLVEVFHARFTHHAYPAHTHTAWTLLIVDDGAIRFDLDRHHHGAAGSAVTLLPPHVPHDGRSATPDGFCKRVLYLEPDVIGAELIGATVDHPTLADRQLRLRVHQLHQALDRPGEDLEAESRLALIGARIAERLATTATTAGPPLPPSSPTLAGRLRDLLDERVADGVSLRSAAARLHAHPTHLVRSFTAAFGLPPHRYLTGRRVELARRLLLAGQRPAEVATAAGFYDQAHLTRHFTRYLGVSPGRYARS
ncbi:AraC family transcriptional regulator [Jiangella ureilytica]|uniref:AraC family transcriptional regulator n=1 Tax=Jiangella ureilytica TaxID=2530374 RepID=A0A4R4RCU2_9ACTN|nr:AraC family transcriptional regulator [Jiangella ureilytica]